MNSSGNSFEVTEELRRYLADLVAEVELQPTENSTGVLGIESHSRFFTLPEDLWFITYESVAVSNGKCGRTTLEVIPVRQDEYHRVRKNPFRGATSRRALRLDLADGVIEVVSKYDVTQYYVRYLKKLEPIVLMDLPNGLAIEGVSVMTPCRVHETLHKRILEMAVEMALRNKLGSASGGSEKKEKDG